MHSVSGNRNVNDCSTAPIIVSFVEEHCQEMGDSIFIQCEGNEEIRYQVQPEESLIDDNNSESPMPSTSRLHNQQYQVTKLTSQIPDKMSDVKSMLRDFWPSQKRKYEKMSEEEVRNYVRHMELPMARVKKIMKLDDSVRNQMISGDAPLVLSAAAEMFIQEITLRAWQLVDEGRRKTLQKCDIAAACTRSEEFDFLIDIVPRDESKRNQVAHLAAHDQTNSNPAPPSSSFQYVMADCETSGNNVLQLDNGQVLHATAIGQPIPIADPSISFDISQMQLPQGVQLVHQIVQQPQQ